MRSFLYAILLFPIIALSQSGTSYQYLKTYRIKNLKSISQNNGFETFVDGISLKRKKVNHVLRQVDVSTLKKLKEKNSFSTEPFIGGKKFKPLEKDFKQSYFREKTTYPTSNFSELDYVAKDIIRNGYIKFEKNLVIISPYTTNNVDKYDVAKDSLPGSLRRGKSFYDKPNQVFFYPLKNGEKIRLSYHGLAASSLTIPIKWRFGFFENEQSVSQELTAGVSGIFHLGYNIGTTTFQFHEGSENSTSTFDIVFGPLIGLGAVTLTPTNTFSALDDLPDGTTFSNGYFSYGAGTTLTFDKFTFGVFYGKDVSLGDNSKDWKFNNKPWVGLGVGIIVFK